MIEGDDGSDPESGAKAHNMEEERLFSVALSRAHTHLRLYLCLKQPNGNNGTPSPYFDWFTANEVAEIANPAMMPLPVDAPRPAPITVTWPED
jgi:DNA helicase II / ATP-dependent DNA helicase PcrA